MSDEILRRFITADTLEIRKLSEGKTGMAGMAANFNSRSTNLGGFYEMLMPGCFDDCLRDENLTGSSDPKALLNHNPDILLGRTQNGSLRLEQRMPKGDSKGGLHQETDFLDTQDARDTATKIKAGLISQQSFAFTVPKDGDSWDIDENGDAKRSVHKMGKLYDVSPVTYPAYGDTDVGSRSMVTNAVLGILVKCERSLPVTKSDLETLKDYSERFGKIIAAHAPSVEAPKPANSLVLFQQRAKLLGLK